MVVWIWLIRHQIPKWGLSRWIMLTISWYLLSTKRWRTSKISVGTLLQKQLKRSKKRGKRLPMFYQVVKHRPSRIKWINMNKLTWLEKLLQSTVITITIRREHIFRWRLIALRKIWLDMWWRLQMTSQREPSLAT